MERRIDRALAAAKLCVDNVRVGEDENLCDECGYQGRGGQCMTALIRDLVEIVVELRDEVARLRTCGTCGHRRVCHLLRMYGNNEADVEKPCYHWIERTTGATPQSAAPTAPLSGEPAGEPMEDEEEESE